MRDRQRSKVYAAERSADIFRHDKEQFPDLDAVRRYVIEVCSSKRVQAKYPRAKLIVEAPKALLHIHDGGGTRKARGGWNTGWTSGAYLNFPLWARNEGVILHELAHALRHDPAAHGWKFCETYLDLTLYTRGRAQHDKLKAAFKAHRVKFTKPRAKRELSPEQRAANIERLRLYRERKAATPAD